MSFDKMPPNLSELDENTKTSRLNDIFNEAFEASNDDANFFFNPTSNKPKPQPRRRSTAAAVIINDVPVSLVTPNHKIENCHMCISNNEIRFEDASTHLTQLSLPADHVHMALIDGSFVVLSINDAEQVRFEATVELSAKIAAVLSVFNTVSPCFWIHGNGDDVITRGSTVLFNLMGYTYTGKSIGESSEYSANDKKIKLSSETLNNNVWGHLIGRKRDDKFVFGINGTGFLFDIKRFKHKTKKVVERESSCSTNTTPSVATSILSDDSIQQQQEQHQNSDPINNQNLEVSVAKSDKEEESLDNDIEEAVKTTENSKSESSEKPSVDFIEQLERRITDLEARLATVEPSAPPKNNDKIEFAMELYANIAASTALTSDAKDIVKKIISGTLHL